MVTTSPTVTRGAAGGVMVGANNVASSLIYPNASIADGFFTKINFHEYERNITGYLGRLEGSTLIRPRLRVSMCLPLPINIIDSAGIVTEVASSEIVQNALNSLTSGTDILSAEGFMAYGLAAAKLTAKAFIRNAVPIAESRIGTILNPHTTMLFKGINLKSFNLEWRFSPRSAAEGQLLNMIRGLILEEMHPQASVDRVTLDYPSIVTVEFVNVKGVPFVNYAFIESFSMTHFPSGAALYNDGRPVEGIMSLQLRELDVRTRESAAWDQDNIQGSAGDISAQLPVGAT